MIGLFAGRYSFLSNFYVAPFKYRGEDYPTAEHAYQASKTLDQSWHRTVRLSGHPGRAKRLGQQVPLRADWDDIKLRVMKSVVWAKFTQNPALQEKLLATDEEPLQEGNYWGDSYWGVDLKQQPPAGENYLGRILMAVRKKLQENVQC